MADRQTTSIQKPAASTQAEPARRPETGRPPVPPTQPGLVPALTREDTVLEEIRKAILSLRFGNVQVIVQDGRVVQIDKTEKIRLT